MKLLDLTGKTFGRLTARWFVGYVGKGRMYHWLCSCECGQLVVVSVGNLRAGNSGSCGCLHNEITAKRMTTHGMQGTPQQSMWSLAKTRAKQKRLPFDLQISDIVIPKRCPMLGMDLVQGDGKLHDASPTLDRTIPELGYVKGNVRVISYKANRAKNNLTLEEMKLMVQNW